MKDDDAIAGEVMAAVMSLLNEDGQSIAERMSVADLWLVIQTTVQTLQRDDAPDGLLRSLTPDQAKVWSDVNVRIALKNGQKILAIKEARSITGMSLKESKDMVERMESAYRKTGGWTW